MMTVETICSLMDNGGWTKFSRMGYVCEVECRTVFSLILIEHCLFWKDQLQYRFIAVLPCAWRKNTEHALLQVCGS